MAAQPAGLFLVGASLRVHRRFPPGLLVSSPGHPGTVMQPVADAQVSACGTGVTGEATLWAGCQLVLDSSIHEPVRVQSAAGGG